VYISQVTEYQPHQFWGSTIEEVAENLECFKTWHLHKSKSTQWTNANRFNPNSTNCSA